MEIYTKKQKMQGFEYKYTEVFFLKILRLNTPGMTPRISMVEYLFFKRIPR